MACIAKFSDVGQQWMLTIARTISVRSVGTLSGFQAQGADPMSAQGNALG